MQLPFLQPVKMVPPKGVFDVVFSPNGTLRRPTSRRVPIHPPRSVAFDPSPGLIFWGDDAPPATTPNRALSALNQSGLISADTLAQVRTYLPTAASAAAAFTDSLDPRTQVATYEAKIRNYQGMRTKVPYNVIPGTVWYDNEIAKLRAKLGAAKQKLALAEEGEDATRQWRALGQTGVGVGVVAGVALVVLLLASTARVVRR